MSTYPAAPKINGVAPGGAARGHRGRVPTAFRYVDLFSGSGGRGRKLPPRTYLAVVLFTGLLAVAQFYFLPNNVGVAEFGRVALALSVLQAALQFSDLGSFNASLRSDLPADLRVALRDNAVSTSSLVCLAGIVVTGGLGIVGIGFGLVMAVAFLCALVVVADRANASAAVQNGDEIATTRYNVVWQNSPKLGTVLGSFGGSALWAMAGGLVTASVWSRPRLARRPSWSFLRRHRRLWLPGLAVSLLAFLMTWADTYLLSALVGIEEAGQYQAVVRPLTGATYLYLPVVALIQAAHNTGSRTRERKLTVLGITTGVLGNALIAAVLVVLGPAIWPDFRFDLPVVAAAAVASTGMCAAAVVGVQLLVRGHHLAAAVNSAIGIVILLGVAGSTVGALGALGAALASASAWLFITFCHLGLLARVRTDRGGADRMAIVNRVIRDAGRNYSVDPDIPRSFIRRQYLERGVQLLRGLVSLRRPVFRGRSVRILCARNLHVGRLATIGSGAVVDASGRRGVTLGRGAKIGRRSIVTTTSQLSKRGVGLSIGDFSGIGDHAHIGCSGGVTIGRDVIAGPYVTFHSQEHVTDDVGVTIRSQGTRESAVVVADDVWIGARVTILAGTRIASGTVVAAGSVVRGEFPPNCVIGGAPARILKHRGEG